MRLSQTVCQLQVHRLRGFSEIFSQVLGVLMLHGDPLLSRKSEYSVSLIIHLVQRLPSAEQGGGSGEDEGGGECCKSLLRLLHSPRRLARGSSNPDPAKIFHEIMIYWFSF